MSAEPQLRSLFTQQDKERVKKTKLFSSPWIWLQTTFPQHTLESNPLPATKREERLREREGIGSHLLLHCNRVS
jgi:hypothetical protein